MPKQVITIAIDEDETNEEVDQSDICGAFSTWEFLFIQAAHGLIHRIPYFVTSVVSV